MTEADQVRLDNLLLVEAQTKKIAVELQERAKNLTKDVTATVRGDQSMHLEISDLVRTVA